MKFQKQFFSTVLTLITLALSIACKTISTDAQWTMKLDMAQGIYATCVGNFSAWIAACLINARLIICTF